MFGRLSAWRRPRTPLILQMEAVECGAACLAMILARYGRWVSLEEVREACGISRDGSNALSLIKAARSYGLKAEGRRAELDFFKTLRRPCVVFWKFEHYLVVEGRRGDTFLVNDPALGRRTIALDEFSAGFTGVTLTFEPGPEFRRGGRKPQVLRTLLGQIAGLRGAAFFLVAVTLLLVLPGLLVPMFSKIFVDNVLVEHQGDWVRPLLAVFAGTALFNALLLYLQKWCLARIEMQLTIRAADRMVARIFALPLSFFSQRSSGDIIGRVQANGRVAQVVAGTLPGNLVGLITLAFYAALMIAYDARLAGLVIGLTALNVLAFRWLVSVSRGNNQLIAQRAAQQMSSVVSGLAAIESVKAGGLEDVLFTRWAGHQARLVTLTQRLGRTSQLLEAIPGFIATAVNLTVLGYGTTLVLRGSLSVGDLIAYQTLATSFTAPVLALVGMGGQLEQASADLRRIDDVMNYPLPPAAPALVRGDLRKRSGRVELRGVTFGYSRQSPALLTGFDLTIEPGARVAVVGLSGSGKSTVLKLVAGLIRPWEGEILIDGVPIERIAPAAISQSISLVDQEIVLFGGTVLDNIRLWDPTVGQTDVRRALADACVLDTVLRRPGGLLTTVAEDGGNFSGGERQRIEIARALVRAPSLVLMDEATAALDPIVEKRIDDNIRARGAACLISAHRLSTIRDCDEIIVLDHGKVAQRGLHQTLSAGGEYGRLIAAQ